MPGNPVTWFEIYVSDMQRAKNFYETVLGRTLELLAAPGSQEMPDMEMWSFPMDEKTVGAGGALVKMNGVTPGVGGTMVYFHSEDCAIEAARIIAAGGKLDRPKMPIGQYGHMAIGIDTEGNMFGLHSMH